MTIFIKIGGSLITDKTQEKHFRSDVAERLAAEIYKIHTEGKQPILIGHGSGSFGHYAAKRHNTIHGVSTSEEWRGFAEVATVASELSCLMTNKLQQRDVPVWRIQPSSSAICENGRITSMAVDTIKHALENGIVPLVHGDVAIDKVRGGTIISTETIFTYLAQYIPVKQIILLGEVEGVFDTDGNVIPEITPNNLSDIASALGGSRGTDVTGGMLTKVESMGNLVSDVKGLQIRIADGTQPDLLPAILLQNQPSGTLIHSPNQ